MNYFAFLKNVLLYICSYDGVFDFAANSVSFRKDEFAAKQLSTS